MNFRAEILSKDNEDIFVDYLKRMEAEYAGRRNGDWFPLLRKNYKDYLVWTLCFDNDDNTLAGFSAIQSHFFPNDTVRILTREFFDPTKRQAQMNIWRETPMKEMAKLQLDWLRHYGSYDKAIFTLEPDRNQSVLKLVCRKLNKLGWSFVPQEHKIKTWEEAYPEQYQLYAISDINT